MSGWIAFEWAIMLGLALGLGVWEMVRTRRQVKRDRAARGKGA